jgi:hypothetical protein
MVRFKRLKILGEGVSYPKLGEINMQWIIEKNASADELLKFLAFNGLLKNQRECTTCLMPMSLRKKNDKSDGIRWECSSCASAQSIRDGSMFAKTKLTIFNLLLLLYMWTKDFQNKHASEEADVDPKHVSEWLLKFRKLTRE